VVYFYLNHDLTSVFGHNKQVFAAYNDEECTWLATGANKLR